MVEALPGILAGKEVTVPRVQGTTMMLCDRTGPVRRLRADRVERNDVNFYNPFHWQPTWGTHRGNPLRTGTDEGPGPKQPKVLWAHLSRDHFVAPLVPNGNKDVFASSLGTFNNPGLHALTLDPAATKRVRWSQSVPALSQAVVAAPLLMQGHTSMLIFGDGMHQSEGASLHCVRAGDGFPLWRLPVAGKPFISRGRRLSQGCQPTPSGRSLSAAAALAFSA